MKNTTSTLGDGVEVIIIKKQPSVTFAQSYWNMTDNDNQWIMTPKTQSEILEYAKNNPVH